MKTWAIENGDVVFAGGRIKEISGAECLRQRLENKIKMFQGEWFLSPEAGIDWPSILGQKSSAPLVYAQLRKTLLADEEVKDVVAIDMEEEGKHRIAKVTFSVNSVYGQIDDAAGLSDGQVRHGGEI